MRRPLVLLRVPARGRRSGALLLAVVVLTSACAVGDQERVVLPTTSSPLDAILTDPLNCDPLDERACLLPWPNDAFTVPDPSTPTGRRVSIYVDSTPVNAAGTPIDPTDQNRADGWSPASTIILSVPQIDPVATGLAGSTDIAASLAPDHPLVLLDATTGERLAHWAELDADEPAEDRLLLIHPAELLPHGHRIIVALRSPRRSDGSVIPRTIAFQAVIDNTPEPQERARAMRAVLDSLADDGVRVADLHVAWDFTVASTESLTGRLLRLRDDTFAELGEGAPAFTVTAVDTVNAATTPAVRTVEGSFEAPNFLTRDGGPGNQFVLGGDGSPIRNGDEPTTMVPFRCVVPTSVAAPVPGIVYSHGLMGSRREVDALTFAAAQGLAVVCGVDSIGMSQSDLTVLPAVLADLSLFEQVADRLQQGMLHQMLLGRLLNHPDGLASDPAFRADDAPVLRPASTVFVGNSQGGVQGGAVSAVSPEWSRAVLGVPGVNYTLMLPRSSDWPQFRTIFDAAYTDRADRLVALQLAQMLWDRGENAGYAQHLTSEPLPGSDVTAVMLVEAFGDHQVPNVATEILARTIGAAVHAPALGDGRSNDRAPLWGIPPLQDDDPTAVLVVWDYGTPAPPPDNRPPTSPEFGEDPHGAGSREPLVLLQALTFLIEARFLDVCAGAPCVSTVLTGRASG